MESPSSVGRCGRKSLATHHGGETSIPRACCRTSPYAHCCRRIAAGDIDGTRTIPQGDRAATAIHLIYRSAAHQINDLAQKEQAGEDVSAIKHALNLGRCVSSIAGEFDHKSAFQVFTSPEFSAWFTGEERRVFKKHVPWTRMVEEIRTSDPEGREVDLLAWLSRHREEIVLKPNRSYGGEGILIGKETSDAEWSEALDKGAKAPGTWVAQGYRPVPEKDFPVIDEDGVLGSADYFSVLGLFASVQRLAILGRASRKKVVNVAQKGGVVAVLRLL